MTMQEKVKKFVETYDLDISPYVRYIDLTSEVGELGKELLKATDYGKTEFTKTSGMELELGDALFPLICLALSLDIDIEAALDAVLKKYEDRFYLKGDIGSGR